VQGKGRESQIYSSGTHARHYNACWNQFVQCKQNNINDQCNEISLWMTNGLHTGVPDNQWNCNIYKKICFDTPPWRYINNKYEQSKGEAARQQHNKLKISR
jgi:hypothetical protein